MYKRQSHHEKLLRDAAANNSKMEWLNVSMIGLMGKCHPIMDNIYMAREVEKLRPAIKMLAGDYYTFTTKFVLDCTSYNLPSTYRYSTNDPKTTEIFSLSRDLCYTLHSKRMRLLHNLKKNINSSSI